MGVKQFYKPAGKAQVKRGFTDPWHFVAYGFGSGLSPVAPGTAGSVVGVVLAVACLSLPIYWAIGIVVVVTAVGVLVSDRVARELDQKDPGGIVIDEIAGQMITLLIAPAHWPWWLLGFFWFRFFDVLKPWPASWCDRELPGGWGVMMDDIVAGIYGLIALQLCIYGWQML